MMIDFTREMNVIVLAAFFIQRKLCIKVIIGWGGVGWGGVGWGGAKSPQPQCGKGFFENFSRSDVSLFS